MCVYVVIVVIGKINRLCYVILVVIFKLVVLVVVCFVFIIGNLRVIYFLEELRFMICCRFKWIFLEEF